MPNIVPAHAGGVAPAPSEPLDLTTIVDTAARFVATEYASLTRAGAPITWPVTPYRGASGRTIDVTTGLAYPLKAERARRDPRVALSFSFPVGSGLDPAPTMLVQGLATVRDADLVETSSRYMQAAADRFPEIVGRTPTLVLRTMSWYWTRAWIEVTPTRVWWWPNGRLDDAPLMWAAPSTTTAPPSDPAPSGQGPGSWSGEAPDWRIRRRGALDRLGLPVLTTLDAEGWPLPWRALRAEETADGYIVEAPAGITPTPGPAFVTFHEHSEVFDGQENLGLAGVVEVEGSRVHVRVQRALADFGVPRNPLRSAVSMLRAGRRLRPRLRAEVVRRGVELPTFADLRFVRPPRRAR